MVRRCVVPICGESSDLKKIHLSFHVFPRDQNRKIQWLKAIQKENFIPSKFSVVCSKHFTTSCFVGRRLKTDAIPTIFKFPNVKSIKEQLKNKIHLTEENIPNINAQSSSQTAENSTLPNMSSYIVPNKEPSPERQPVYSSDDSSASSLISAKHLTKRYKERTNIPVENRSDSSKSNANISCITLLSEDPLLETKTKTSSTSTASETSYENKKLIKQRSNRYLNPKFVGDCLYDDLEIPWKRKRNWNIAIKQISAQKKKIRYLNQRVRRLQTKVTNLTTLIKELKNKT